MSVLDKIVSYFPSKNATSKGVETSLLSILQSDKHKNIIQHLRASDPIIQKTLKEKLPCFTVAGTFSHRSKEGIKELSGLAAVDLDSAEDYDVIHLLHELQKLPCIAYAGLSCRGSRLWAIVPFLYPDKYVKHYQRLIQSFADMGLPIGDECHKQISQPRFVSWNDATTQFFNHNAEPYDLIAPEKIVHTFTKNQYSIPASAPPENAFQWCNEQINKSHTFKEKERHNYILKLARYCNMKGLSKNETLNGCLQYIQPDFDEEEISSIVRYIYLTQSESHNTYPFSG